MTHHGYAALLPDPLTRSAFHLLYATPDRLQAISILESWAVVRLYFCKLLVNCRLPSHRCNTGGARWSVKQVRTASICDRSASNASILAHLHNMGMTKSMARAWQLASISVKLEILNPRHYCAGTSAAVLMRMNALRAALRKSSGGTAGLGHAMQEAFESRARSTRGYSMRERMLAPGAMAEDALAM